MIINCQNVAWVLQALGAGLSMTRLQVEFFATTGLTTLKIHNPAADRGHLLGADKNFPQLAIEFHTATDRLSTSSFSALMDMQNSTHVGT